MNSIQLQGKASFKCSYFVIFILLYLHYNKAKFCIQLISIFNLADVTSFKVVSSIFVRSAGYQYHRSSRPYLLLIITLDYFDIIKLD